MRILFVCQYFENGHIIGSVRPTAFATYLSLQGHVVTVVHGNIDLYKERQREKVYKSFIVNYNSIIKKKTSSSNSHESKCLRKSKYKEAIRKIAKYIAVLYDNYRYYQQAKYIISHNFNKCDFDIVYSTYSPFSSIFIGNYVKRKNIANKWMLDFRDLLTSSSTISIANYLNVLIEKLYSKKADLITVVSQGQANVFLKRNRKLVNKVSIITNGYGGLLKPDMKFITEDFTLLYAGSLYKGERDLGIIFKALSELKDENRIGDNIRIDYVGCDFGYLKEQVEKIDINLCRYLYNYGAVSKEDSLNRISKADVLLMATWNYIDDQGVITGKFYDYLSSSKNIIAVVSGNYPNAEISQLISELQVGFSYEMTVSSRENLEKLKDYLFRIYDFKLKNGFTPYDGIMDKIICYDYNVISKSFERICKKLMYE